MRKINGQPIEASTDISSTEGGEVLKWDADNTRMVWELQDGTTFVPILWYGDRGVSMQSNHNASYGTRMDYINISSIGDSADFGDQACKAWAGGAASNGTRGISFGGYCYGGTGAYQNAIKYITFASLGNVTDAGDLPYAKEAITGISDGTYGYACGYADFANNISWVNISTTNNATDFGDLSVGRHSGSSVGNNTRGIMTGGQSSGGAFQDTMDYITMATAGNALDFGNLLNNRHQSSGSQCNDSTRGLIMSGCPVSLTSPTNVIEYITIATTSDALDFGDLTVARKSGGTTSNSTRAVCMGGDSGSSYVNTIDYVTIQTTANALDFGDLYTTMTTSAVASGD